MVQIHWKCSAIKMFGVSSTVALNSVKKKSHIAWCYQYLRGITNHQGSAPSNFSDGNFARSSPSDLISWANFGVTKNPAESVDISSNMYTYVDIYIYIRKVYIYIYITERESCI